MLDQNVRILSRREVADIMRIKFVNEKTELEIKEGALVRQRLKSPQSMKINAALSQTQGEIKYRKDMIAYVEEILEEEEKNGPALAPASGTAV